MVRQRKRNIHERRMRLWQEQNGFCAMCGLPMDYEETCVDHDHAHCGVDSKLACGYCDRGGLHSVCNSLLGFANDDIELLEKAIQYLRLKAIK